MSQLRGSVFHRGDDGLHPDALRLNEGGDAPEEKRGRALRQALAEELTQ